MQQSSFKVEVAL